MATLPTADQAKAALTVATPYLKSAAQTAGDHLGHALDHFDMYVQQGPDGVRFLAFLGGFATTIMGLLDVINIFDFFLRPSYYFVCLAQVIFGVITIILEASPAVVSTYPRMEHLQRTLNEYCKFLTLLWGRGTFYIYFGAHTMFLNSVISISFFLGVYMVLMGAFYMAWFWGYDVSKPTGAMIDKIKESAKLVKARFSRGQPASDYVRIEE